MQTQLNGPSGRFPVARSSSPQDLKDVVAVGRRRALGVVAIFTPVLPITAAFLDGIRLMIISLVLDALFMSVLYIGLRRATMDTRTQPQPPRNARFAFALAAILGLLEGIGVLLRIVTDSANLDEQALIAAGISIPALVVATIVWLGERKVR